MRPSVSIGSRRRPSIEQRALTRSRAFALASCCVLAWACWGRGETVEERFERSSHALGVGPCGVEISKIKYDQIGADNGDREAIEIRVASFAVGNTFTSCGVTSIAPYEGSTCLREAANRVIEIGAIEIPSSGVAVFSRSGSLLGVEPLATATISTGAWLENGPDFVALESQGAIVSLLAIPGASGPPNCVPDGYAGQVEVLPALAEGTSNEHVLIACPGGYVRVDQSIAPWLGANPCPSDVDAGVTDDASVADASNDVVIDGATEDANENPNDAGLDASSEPDADADVMDATIDPADAASDVVAHDEPDASGSTTTVSLTITITAIDSIALCRDTTTTDRSVAETTATPAQAAPKGGCSVSMSALREMRGEWFGALLLAVVAIRARRACSVVRRENA